MTRKSFLGALAGAAALPAQPRRRNVVFILADDHRYDFAGALGHPWLKTPHIDRLIRGGTVFRNAFVTTSLCSPSRASLLTGLYAHAHRVTDNFTPLDPSLPIFPGLLRQAGYRTAFVGKWHMGGASDEPRPGFDHWVSFFGQGQYFDPEINVNGARRKTSGYVTDILSEQALSFLRDNSARPFCLYLSHKAVHYPFEPAPRHRDLYRDAPVPRPRSMNFTEEDMRQRPEWVRRRRYARQGVDGLYGHEISFDEAYRGYARSLAAVDDSTGAVLGELARLGLLDDTLVIYMGDNGLMWGEHCLTDKRAMYEPSIRVPMWIHCPRLAPPGSTVSEMALNLDIAPTILDAAGVAVPKNMQGRSLLPLLRGERAGWRQDFLYEYDWEFDYPYTPTLTGLRTERYSYCQTYGLWDLDELYDVAADPGQMNNLLGSVRIVRQRGRLTEHIPDPKLKSLVESLQDRMKRILEETGGDPRRSGRSPEGLKYAL
ncbi:MAG: sulfatase [Acidobacteria bacterium]|nr:sulfatase [Acidobacteriota bacterium]